VRRERPNELRPARDEIEADRAAAARAVHVRRLVAHPFEERRRVVGVDGHGDVLGLAVERAA